MYRLSPFRLALWGTRRLSTATQQAQVPPTALAAVDKLKPLRVHDAVVGSDGGLRVSFNDDTTWDFHAMWLRDSWRDDSMFDMGQGSRTLSSSLALSGALDVRASGVEVEDAGGALRVQWDGTEEGAPASSDYAATWLRAWADFVARPAGGASTPVGLAALDDWAATMPKQPQLWDSSFKVPEFRYEDIVQEGEAHEQWVRCLIDPGVALVRGLPRDEKADGSVLEAFMQARLGRLMAHPLRETPFWVIRTDETDAARLKTLNYRPNFDLANHTDQAVYGAPGQLLTFHCVSGQGGNTSCDGFAVAEAMRQEHPELFEALTKPVGMGRHVGFYTRGKLEQYVFTPVIKLDDDGNVSQITVNEQYRSPITVSYEDFPVYWRALQKWFELTHSPRFLISFELHEGEAITFNNHRVLHGRAGVEGKSRIILGGTTARDVYLNRVRLLEQAKSEAEQRHMTAAPPGVVAALRRMEPASAASD